MSETSIKTEIEKVRSTLLGMSKKRTLVFLNFWEQIQ
jgi:hypothetical protein